MEVKELEKKIGKLQKETEESLQKHTIMIASMQGAQQVVAALAANADKSAAHHNALLGALNSTKEMLADKFKADVEQADKKSGDDCEKSAD